jgi:hypothetical protein
MALEKLESLNHHCENQKKDLMIYLQWNRRCRKSVSGRASALHRNLIHRHPCRSSDLRCRFKDTTLPRSAAQ